MSGHPPDRPRGEPPAEWSAAERAALERLGAEGPPDDLEEAVVASLAGRGLLAGAPPGDPARNPRFPREPQTPRVPARRAWAWGALAAAAALAAFVAGISISDRGAGRVPAPGDAPAAAGDRTPAAVDPAPSAGRYMLLLYEDVAYRAPATAEERAARVEEYVAWAAELRERGIEIEGEELAPAGEAARLDGGRDGLVSMEGAPAGPLGVLAGYFVVAAPDRDAAVAIARTTPHLAHGGTVVVRRVVEH